ncbi:MAG: alpha/beta hydrolase [Dechloromonas sp.]|uniref:alpha/beta hydrolase n=1 Tax=Dechloromonas sp. TaxID=1917218 RepID=UPI0027EA5138|nr:alpha/beta hydrolase [Dechloromonas sp.]MBT9519519.1 alpha/beta hydrolase [Dechloromonas sp.]
MNDTIDLPRTAMVPTTFPIGYHNLHPDTSMNFQMNRWFDWVGEKDMLDEMRSAAPRIANYRDWKREFLALAENAAGEGHILRAGFYFRAADFFMRPDDADRSNARERFLGAMRSVYGLDQLGRHEIPYATDGVKGTLPAYRFTPSRPKGMIVFFGGFDSYIEELTSAFFYLRDAGYEVVAFEGPGQGGALNDAGLHMTAAWHEPVKAVLDYFKLDHVTLAGLSMGGCLVMRAAAFEPRVDRVVAYDVYPDALDTVLRQVKPVQRGLLKVLLKLRAAPVVNAMARRVAQKSHIAQWGIEEGMHVTGSSSPYGYFQSTKAFVTADVSALIKQDVLLLAGSEDHLVPMAHFHQQIKALQNARSITARLFTRSESAQNHCQVGNYGLALRTIVNWLNYISVENTQPLLTSGRDPVCN